MASLRADGLKLGAIVFFLCAGATLAAQDRVILFESYTQRGPSIEPMFPGAIQDIEITQGGRGWNVVRTVQLPAHFSTGGLVPLADGTQLL